MSEFYYYGMRLRGFSLGAQPMKGIIEALAGIGGYHNILKYSRKLDESECKEYELDYLGMRGQMIDAAEGKK